MQINDILGRMGGLGSIAKQLGLSEEETARGAEALAPRIVEGFERKQMTEQADGSGLEGLLGRLGGSDLLDNLTSDAPTDINRGNNVLGEIFGSKDVSRSVARDASAKTGLDSSVLKKMLPMVAMIVTGYMAKQRMAGAGAGREGNGGLGDMLGGVLGRFSR